MKKVFLIVLLAIAPHLPLLWAGRPVEEFTIPKSPDDLGKAVASFLSGRDAEKNLKKLCHPQSVKLWKELFSAETDEEALQYASEDICSALEVYKKSDDKPCWKFDKAEIPAEDCSQITLVCALQDGAQKTLSFDGALDNSRWYVTSPMLEAVRQKKELPNLLKNDKNDGSKRAANELRTPENMKVLFEAQKKFKERIENDADDNGGGEFGYLDELEASRLINFSVLGVAAASIAEKNGYLYKIFLFAPQDGEKENATINEKHYLLTVWPKKYGKTGIPCFVMTPEGKMYTCDNPFGMLGDGVENSVEPEEVLVDPWNPEKLRSFWKLLD